MLQMSPELLFARLLRLRSFAYKGGSGCLVCFRPKSPRYRERNRMSIRRFSKGSTALLVLAFLVACSSVANPPASVVADAPTIMMVVPQSDGVGTNREIAVVFSKPMD